LQESPGANAATSFIRSGVKGWKNSGSTERKNFSENIFHWRAHSPCLPSLAASDKSDELVRLTANRNIPEGPISLAM
jgi:hypothetical protein